MSLKFLFVAPAMAEKPPEIHGEKTLAIQFLSASSGMGPGIETLLKGERPLEFHHRAEAIKIVGSFDPLLFESDRKAPQIKAIEVESCKRPFQDGVDFFFYPEWRRLHVEGGGKKLRADLAGKENSQFDSFAIHFRHNSSLCLKALSFLDEVGEKIPTRFVPSVPGHVSGAGAVDFLIDARPDTSWNLEKSKLGSLNIEFTSPQVVDRIFVWNGDQKGESSFSGRGRFAGLNLTSKDGYAEVLSLKDSVGMQEIRLKKPFSGKNLELTPILPKNPKGDVTVFSLSEIRFGGPVGVFSIESAKSVRRLRESALREFGGAGVIPILDSEVRSVKSDEPWIFRFRGDGTYFVRGFTDEVGVARVFTSSGTYEIQSEGEKKLTLNLFGVRRSSALPWDGFICGLACSKKVTGAERIVSDRIVLEKFRGKTFMVRNKSEKGSRDLPFEDIQIRVSSLLE